MGHIRVVEQVAIVDWDPGRLPEVVGELRGHIEQNHGRAVLLNLAKADLRADELETLVEATTVCRDRSSPVAIYGASQDLERLLELLGLDGELPPVLAPREDEALAAIKKDGANVRAPAKPVRAAPPTPVPTPLPPPVPAALESIPAPLRELATAVTERFDPISDVAEVGPPVALRAAAAAAQPADDVLAINWADLARTGYQIGGPGGDKLRGEAARSAPTPARAKRPEDDVIDLDEPRGKKPARPFQKTEVLPAFKVEEGSSPDAAWSAQPGKTPAALVPAALDEEPPTGDYSPVDTGAGAPPAFLAAAPPATVSPQPTKRPAAPPPKPVEAAKPPAAKPPPATKPAAAKPPPARPSAQPPAQPPAPPPARPAAAAAASTPYYDPGSDDGDEQTVMFQATVPVPGQQVYPQTDGAFTDSDDQMVMFQPGAQDLALLAQMAQAGAQPEVPAETTDEDEGLSQDETIMFQPGALDAALLAEVAAAAGPETHIPPPPVADPPEPEQPSLQLPDARELEVRLFMHDYALSTEQHLALLDRFLRAGDETVAPQDLTANGERAGGNGAAGAALAIVDQFVHSRLVRRTRSPRARGGTGFVFSPSPQVRGLAVRLVKMWQTSSSQARVGAWLAEERA